MRVLQADGHVSIDPDTGDRRGYRIAATEAGHAMLTDFREGLVTRFSPVLEGWDAAEVHQLADGLSLLNQSMDAARHAAAARTTAPSWWRAATSDDAIPVSEAGRTREQRTHGRSEA